MGVLASYSTTVVFNEVNKSKGFATVSPLQQSLRKPFPVTVECVDIDGEDRTLHIQSAEELISILALDSTSGIVEDIEENSVDGTVHCTLCPYALEMDQDRQLIFGKTRQDVESAAVLACDCI